MPLCRKGAWNFERHAVNYRYVPALYYGCSFNPDVFSDLNEFELDFLILYETGTKAMLHVTMSFPTLNR